MKNKKGVVVFIYFCIGIVFFVLGMALAPILNSVIGESTSSTQLNCSNESISNQDKSVCYQMDMMTPLWFGVILGFSGIVLARMFGG